jgi:hypothetical protein
MKFATKYTPEQWAEARCLRAQGLTFPAIAERLGFAKAATVKARARQEGWPNGKADGAVAAKAKPKPKARAASPATIDTRRRLAQRLYKIVEFRIKRMELSMQKQVQALEQGYDDLTTPAVTREERESFAALIEQINQVTEMASDPATAADGRRKSASLNPELTALSDDLDPDAVAAASEKDALRREIADKLEKLVPPA